MSDLDVYEVTDNAGNSYNFRVFENDDISELFDKASEKIGEALGEAIEKVASADSEKIDIADVENVEEVVRSVRPSDATGLKRTMLEILGEYDMTTKIVTYQSSSGYASTQVTTEPDYPWIMTASIFGLFALLCVFLFFKGVYKALC